MKRCPHCQFIYPDSDETCDFDQTTLEVVDDATIDAATAPGSALSEAITPSKATLPKRSRKIVPIAVVCGLFIILMVLGVSVIALKRQRVKTSVVQNSGPAPTIPVIVAQPPQVTETPLPSPSPESSPDPSPVIAKSSPSPPRSSTSRTEVSTGPVSTSTEVAAKKSGGKPVILLTSGGRLEADEVWRTKEGIWYRRDGMVTLLKRNRVKSIVNQ